MSSGEKQYWEDVARAARAKAEREAQLRLADAKIKGGVLGSPATPELVLATLDALAEAHRAATAFAAYNSAHEGYAVIAEELDELWDLVKTKQHNRDLDDMRKEAIQIAAAAIRFAADVCNKEVGRR